MTTYQFDTTSRTHWLTFDGKPDAATIALLKKEGWRWSRYRKAWHTNRRFAKPPAGIEYVDGGQVDYASERPERLAAAAERAEERSDAAHAQSNSLVADIPFGQPILVGHHSQRHHEKALEGANRAMKQSVEEQKKAEHLTYKAKSSAIHQAYKERPDVIYRRIKRLKSEITSLQNSHREGILYDLSSVKYGSMTKEDMQARAAASKTWLEERAALIQAEIDENQAALDAAGGLPVDGLAVEVGDVIAGGWRGLCEVQKINRRKGDLLSYTCLPLTNTWNSKYVIPKDEVSRVVLRKGEVTSESLLMAKLEAKRGRGYQPPVEPEKKAFAVEQVEVIEAHISKEAAFFPTPAPLADKLVARLPFDALLILEPSAGTGSLAHAVTRLLMERGQNHVVHCCEIVPQLRRSLSERGYTVVGENFIEYQPSDETRYDCIVMNPPFNNAEWLTHVEHAYDLLRPGGTLAAIVPSGFAFRTEKRMVALRKLVEDYGECEPLEADAFAESGTAVRTVMIWIQKPKEVVRSVPPVATIVQVEAAQASLW